VRQNWTSTRGFSIKYYNSPTFSETHKISEI
jgi:hypothetical protein